MVVPRLQRLQQQWTVDQPLGHNQHVGHVVLQAPGLLLLLLLWGTEEGPSGRAVLSDVSSVCGAEQPTRLGDGGVEAEVADAPLPAQSRPGRRAGPVQLHHQGEAAPGEVWPDVLLTHQHTHAAAQAAAQDGSGSTRHGVTQQHELFPAAA